MITDYEVESVKDYEAFLVANTSELPIEAILKAQIETGKELPEHVRLCADFIIEWDDDIAQVYVQSVYAAFPKGTNDTEYIELSEEDIDFGDLGMAIEESGEQSEWYEDRIAAASDWEPEYYE